jgi:ADP-ribosylglycohydrolase
VASYSIALACLLREPDDRGEAFARARKWAEGNANGEVREWLREAREQSPVDFLSQIGFVRIAFVNAFQHLLRGSTYEMCLRETLGRGGDTDTNACIAGALAGRLRAPEAFRSR